MSTARSGRLRRTSLGVEWRLPAKGWSPTTPEAGYAKRPFASTTQASADLIALLAGDGLSWSKIVEAIRFDDEARAIATRFVEAGHGDVAAAVMLRA